MTQTEYQKLFQTMTRNHNRKIGRQIRTFNLPAGLTCGQQCNYCYARKSELLWPGVLEFRLRNYELSKNQLFVESMVNELNIFNKFRILRFHESGDFYSTEYVKKWISIAKALPDWKFYGYTKQNWDSLEILRSLPNVNLINSILPNGQSNVFTDREALKKTAKAFKAKICSYNGKITSKTCYNCGICLDKRTNYVLFMKH